MKWDELAFINTQLAAMLKDGIPLEGALRQLCETMARGDLRTEFEKLQADLANGIPLPEAVAARKLPAFYQQMIKVGVKSGDLPGVLTMVADYYQSTNLVITRLKGLMIYPMIVAVLMLVTSIGSGMFLHRFQMMFDLTEGFGMLAATDVSLWMYIFLLWLPIIVISLLLMMFVLVTTHPGLRRWLSWRIPAFRDICLWQFASAMEVILRGGCRLDEALEMMAQVENQSPALPEIVKWQTRLASGHGKFDQIALPNKLFTPLFIWTVSNAGDELATGFKRAAEIYHGRATYQIESLLYAALPISVLVLGGLMLCQFYSLGQLALIQLRPILWMSLS